MMRPHAGPLRKPGRDTTASVPSDAVSKAVEYSFAYVVGARPNYVKMAPLLAAMKRRLPEAKHVLINTGQHYDPALSSLFLDVLGMPQPDYELEVGSSSHAVQTARVMERIEQVFIDEAPTAVIVPGDVNSTLAAGLTAAKMGIPVVHLEAGLRSFDRSMPEEINRVLVDQISDLLLTHSPEALGNLTAEGIDSDKVVMVGNTMIDALVAMRPLVAEVETARSLGLDPGSYLLVTLHRPKLVDGPLLGEAMAALSEVASEMPVLFPVHPRTRARLADFAAPANLKLVHPLGYLDFLSVQGTAKAVLTDSGGVQEETTFLGVPCFTLRDNTERPVTVDHGTNMLLGLDPAAIMKIPRQLAQRQASEQVPELWDGSASERSADAIERLLLSGIAK